MWEGSGLLAGIKTYASECFSHPFYWLIFIADAFEGLSWVGAGFGLLAATKYLHFSLEFIGEVSASCGIIALFLSYPGGMIADRFHPLKLQIAINLIGLFLTPLTIWYYFVWHPTVTPQTSRYIFIALNGISLPLGAVSSACGLTMLMKLFPQGHYGQFCSANAMIRAVAMILGGVGCGLFLDSFKACNPDPDYCYRFLVYWTFGSTFGFVFFLCLVHRYWERLGGLNGYKPPITWIEN